MNFGKNNYRLILKTALEKQFEFVNFQTVDITRARPQIILRHDVDYCWPFALEMAEIDASFKVQSTFTVLLSSPLYNVFTNTNVRIVNEIHELGHNIVLHHGVLLGQSPEEITRNIARETQVIRAYFPFVKPVFIWHQPTANKPPHNMEVPGMVNAYHDNFIKKMHYISDSYLNRPDVFLTALGEYKLLQLLFHPFIWMSDKDDMVSMVAHTLKTIILSCDEEFMINQSWKEKFPGGIPEGLLDNLEKSLTEK